MKLSIGTIAALAAVIFAAASPAFASSAVPEPASLSLVGVGIGAVMLVRKLRKR